MKVPKNFPKWIPLFHDYLKKKRAFSTKESQNKFLELYESHYEEFATVSNEKHEAKQAAAKPRKPKKQNLKKMLETALTLYQEKVQTTKSAREYNDLLKAFNTSLADLADPLNKFVGWQQPTIHAIEEELTKLEKITSNDDAIASSVKQIRSLLRSVPSSETETEPKEEKKNDEMNDQPANAAESETDEEQDMGDGDNDVIDDPDIKI